MSKSVTVEVRPNTINMFGTCNDCGWTSVEVCCNDGFADNMLDADGDQLHADWFCYCLNKGCKHHKGYEVGQGCDEVHKYFKWSK